MRFTPLFIALIAIETTDLMFATDSIPAVLAVSHHPFVVYSSNIFAVLGLRSLYFAWPRCWNDCISCAMDWWRFWSLSAAR